MDRKKFIEQSSVALGGFVVLPTNLHAFFMQKDSEWKRILSLKVEQPVVTFPKEKRVPLNWEVFALSATQSPEEFTLLYFPKIKKSSHPLWLRITAAIDFREELTVSAFLPESNLEIGQFDIKYAHPFQPFEIKIDSKHIDDIGRQGIALRMISGKNHAWFFKPNQNRTDNLGLQPHFLTGRGRVSYKAFQENLRSMNSLSPFGWMGGSVQDALWEISKDGDEQALEILRNQLDLYLTADGIKYENTRTEPLDNTFNSIEDFLPFAAIVGLYPIHPSVQSAVDFLKSKESPDGMIVSDGIISTEGCYTVAYPLAAIAAHRKDKDLAQVALNQLKFRMQFLANKSGIFQRSSLDGAKSFKNWGRGIAWYLLGTIKTLEVLKHFHNDVTGWTEIEHEFQRAVREVCMHQNREGMWYSFIDKVDTEVDTSATAGIASALAWGVRTKSLEESYLKKSKAAHESIKQYLTPDGFLTQITQINRGGEDLQANGYRVISQFGMGLFAQLDWLLKL